MDPLISPEMADWLAQKRQALADAYAQDKADQEAADRKALMMQFAQSYVNQKPMEVKPRQVSDARSRFATETGLENKAQEHTIQLLRYMREKAGHPGDEPAPPEWGAPKGMTKSQAITAGYQHAPKVETPDVLEPDLVERAKKWNVPTDKRKREPVIADILAAERGQVAANKESGKEERTAKTDAAKAAIELRKEFKNDQVYKDTQQVLAAAKKIAGTSESGAGDMSLIYGYMKILDPNSTVREGEYATAQNVGSVPQSIVGAYNRAITGEKLPPEVRQQFKAEAQKVVQAQLGRYNTLATQYRELAKRSGISPGDVVLDIGEAGGGSSHGAVKRTGKNLRTGKKVIEYEDGFREER